MKKKRICQALSIAALLIVAPAIANAQDPDCTVGNWDEAVNLADGDTNQDGNVGTPPNFQRYSGKCSLDVVFGGADGSWVANSTDMNGAPLNEQRYIARFYVFVDALEGSNVPIFEANDGVPETLFSISYSAGSPATFGIDLSGNGSPDQTISATAGWNSVEFDYDGAAGTLAVSINGAADVNLATTSGGSNVVRVRLGDLDGAGSGFAYFDAFDSRRNNRPGRLCRGLTTALGDPRDSLLPADAIAIFTEFSTGGNVLAEGQPDFNGDGQILPGDAISAFQRFATGNAACALNQ